MTSDIVGVIELRDKPPIGFVVVKERHRPAGAEAQFVAEFQRHLDGVAYKELVGGCLTGVDHLNPEAAIGIQRLLITDIGDELGPLPFAPKEKVTSKVDLAGYAIHVTKPWIGNVVLRSFAGNFDVAAKSNAKRIPAMFRSQIVFDAEDILARGRGK